MHEQIDKFNSVEFFPLPYWIYKKPFIIRERASFAGENM